MRYRVLISGEDRETYSGSAAMAAYWAAIEMDLHGSTIAEVYEFDRPDECVGVYDVECDKYGFAPKRSKTHIRNPYVKQVTLS